MADSYWRYVAERDRERERAAGIDLSAKPVARDYPSYVSLASAHDIPASYLSRENSQLSSRDLAGSYFARENAQTMAHELSPYPPRERSHSLGHDLPGYPSRETSQLDDRIGSTLRQRDAYGATPDSIRNKMSPYGASALTSGDVAPLVGDSGGGLIGASAGIGHRGLPTVDDKILLSQKHGVGLDTSVPGRPSLADLYNTRLDTSRRVIDARMDTPVRSFEIPRADPSSKLPEHLRGDATSNTIFVEGLPIDCTRREVAHIFRPFIGFKQLKVIHKEPRGGDEEPYVLCFVEFADTKCALTALHALQGYKVDDSEVGASSLKLQLAHFPGTRPSIVGAQ
eukprot:TRINITY_DN4918_c0_g1_i1.p1 TRINITY_DN4918_c0_g1~~TRINITY_DN4918_c0_g1_i1.p1  ORF type:complete len:340 (+),score=78.29 TRINITY_DN4918_c0_g1_i1:387-1406(+)